MAGVGTGALVGTGAIAVVVPVAVLVERSSSTLRKLAVWVLFTSAALAAIGIMAHRLLPAAGDPERLRESVSLLVFLGLLPLLNAFWDRLSLGISRGLLAGIRLGRHLGWVPMAWALTDFVLAFAFLAALVATITVAVALLNLLYQTGGGTGLLVDLPALFADLRATPADPRFYWLYFMLLSTLIPTLVHLLIDGASAMQTLAYWPAMARWRAETADLMKQHSVRRHFAALYLTCVPMLGLVVPLGLLWLLQHGLAAHGGALGTALIDWADTIATAITD